MSRQQLLGAAMVIAGLLLLAYLIGTYLDTRR